ncbi:MAG: hypothetical protein HQ522_00600 [Bacteroidetes bacterium]|nr:hypothetical protein [Bacteroidota bacterium]
MLNLLTVFTILFIFTSCTVSKKTEPFNIDIIGLEKSTIHVPARVITKASGHHWFGYYDKLQFDPTNRFVLCMETSFEGRSPKPEDEITIGMVDLENNDEWIELGNRKPGDGSKVVCYNLFRVAIRW